MSKTRAGLRQRLQLAPETVPHSGQSSMAPHPEPYKLVGRGYPCGQASPSKVLPPPPTMRLAPPHPATEPDVGDRTDTVMRDA